MKKEFSSSLSWNSAAVAGLVMAIATIILDYLPTLVLAIGIKGFIGSFLVFLVKIAKIAACIYVFKVLIDRFNGTVKTDYARLQRYGLKIALFSSILVAGFSLVQILVINPEMMTQMIQEVQNTYQNLMDSNTLAEMEKMISKLPVITFFSSLIYCYLWGWILSTTFARRLFPVNTFGERPGNDENPDNDIQ